MFLVDRSLEQQRTLDQRRWRRTLDPHSCPAPAPAPLPTPHDTARHRGFYTTPHDSSLTHTPHPTPHTARLLSIPHRTTPRHSAPRITPHARTALPLHPSCEHGTAPRHSAPLSTPHHCGVVWGAEGCWVRTRAPRYPCTPLAKCTSVAGRGAGWSEGVGIRKVGTRLPGKGNSNSRGAGPVYSFR